MAAVHLQSAVASAFPGIRSPFRAAARRLHSASFAGSKTATLSKASVLQSEFLGSGFNAAPAQLSGTAFLRRSASSTGARASANVEQLRGARDEIKELIKSKHCNPILIRLGWHDAGTYTKSIAEWPKAGGATASIRFKPEIEHGANAGLAGAIALLEPIKQKYPAVSYADLFQLASAIAVEVRPRLRMLMLFAVPQKAPGQSRSVHAGPPSPADHLRKVFYRMGLDDKDIVALSGAHTLGRARPDRSGWGKAETKYTGKLLAPATTLNSPPLPSAPLTCSAASLPPSLTHILSPPVLAPSPSPPPPCRRTALVRLADIKEKKDAELLVLPTDAALFEDAGFKVFAEKYAADQAAFFADYAQSHKKLSELGAKFDPPQAAFFADYAQSHKQLSELGAKFDPPQVRPFFSN
ncbi:unnamed protein product [Closterium sp. Naga37s-1]|nr:unnamed protein product [Closterium sp. Naga37s-1]